MRCASVVDWDCPLFLDPTIIKTIVEINMLRSYEQWTSSICTDPNYNSVRSCYCELNIFHMN